MCSAIESYAKQLALEKAKEMAISLNHQGVSVDVIAKAANVAVETVKQWLAPASA